MPRRREVFLSHASPDRRWVERLARCLDEHGIRYFYSKKHIAGARQWHDELGAALERCNWFFLVLSPRAVKSVWVKRELLFALDARQYRNRIVPLMIADSRMKALSWTLPHFQWIDFRDGFQQGRVALLRLLGVGPTARRRTNSQRRAIQPKRAR